MLDDEKAQCVRPTAGATVFLSYSRVDRAYVSKLATWLKGHGVRVWFDHSIEYGSKWKTEIIRQVDAASALVLVMTASSRASTWVVREVRRARRNGIPVLPLMLELNQLLDCVSDLHNENVIHRGMPSLEFCQKLPGFLVSQADLAKALSEEKQAIAACIGGGKLWREGMSGPVVAAIQCELIRVGLDSGEIDGKFGPKTRRAVMEFQRLRCNMATVDGHVGPLTLMTLVHSALGDLAPTEH